MTKWKVINGHHIYVDGVYRRNHEHHIGATLRSEDAEQIVREHNMTDEMLQAFETVIAYFRGERRISANELTSHLEETLARLQVKP